MQISKISIQRPTLVVVLFSILTLMGLLSYFSLNYELFPKFASNVITITTVYPGAGPEEVESSITKKIENAVAAMENVKKLTAISSDNLSVLTIQLTTAANADVSLEDAQRRVNVIISDLPTDAKTPSLNKFDLSDLPIITLSATANMEATKLYDIVNQKIQPMLSRLPGMAQATLVGGEEREIQINVNAQKLEAYKLSLAQVRQVVTNANQEYPTGAIKTDEQNMSIRLQGKLTSIDELRNLVVTTTDNGTQVRLSDIADVQDGIKDQDQLARVDQKESIAIQLQKQTDANAVTVSKEVKAAVVQLEDEYKSFQLKLGIANDTSTFTLDSANSVIRDLFIAVLLVAAVMLLFLHTIRNAFITMISIPASLIATFIGMKLFNFSLNLMSLLGLSLVVGILVDDAIVVLENIQRHMEMGKNRVRASYDAVAEIGVTVMSITAVIIVVFLPISLTNEIVSQILKQFCIVVMIATAFSLLSSFTIVPLLSSRIGKLEHLTGKNIFEKFIMWFERRLEAFTHWMSSLLRWALRHRVATMLVATVLLFSSFYLVGGGYIGGEFIPNGDRGQFIVALELPKDASVQQTNQATMKAEAFLAKKAEVVSMITVVGQASADNFGQANQAVAYESQITVTLVDESKRSVSSDIYAAHVKQDLQDQLTGVKVKTLPVSILGSAQAAPIQLDVLGADLDSAMAFATVALDTLRTLNGITEAKLSMEEGTPEIDVHMDRDKMSALGLTLDVVGATMATAFQGTADDSKLKYRQGAYEYDMNLRFGRFDRKNMADVSNLAFINSHGELVRLNQFATVTEGSGPSELERRDKSPSVSVRSQVIGRPSGTVTAEFAAKLLKMKRPVGVTYIFAGDQENQGDAFATLGVALLISIVVVYLIMVALYDSYIYPLVVMGSLPMALIGALLALALTNNTLNIFTILGLIMLMGLVAKNAIILVDFTNQSKAEGHNTVDALIYANHARLRPILMTTIAMVFGMLPIALAHGGVSAVENGLAWVVIGGLISSMFLTLIVVPVIYSLADGFMRRFHLGHPEKQKQIIADMNASYTPSENGHAATPSASPAIPH
ncbi:MAG TPA: efflux RND transporter permease subunit [Dinghuibacter sp.]|uniref:efflux RND transporter permease subunit n=1 Tax=Dinghuibacter sp. TaxID=2024697 RepID=UPI002CFD1BDE|nr:efflux RND transporter permease subunit [Dinghuibacter sp.]HTJ11991.1 efflux RND transporter permease subunit [Dinghuibacter sp.]